MYRGCTAGNNIYYHQNYYLARTCIRPNDRPILYADMYHISYYHHIGRFEHALFYVLSTSHLNIRNINPKPSNLDHKSRMCMLSIHMYRRRINRNSNSHDVRSTYSDGIKNFVYPGQKIYEIRDSFFIDTPWQKK